MPSQPAPDERATEETSSASSRAQRIFLRVLFCLSVIPLAATAFGLRLDLALNENRKLADKPAYSFGGLLDASYLGALNKYFDDHFAFREAIIKAKYDIDWAVLGKARDDFVRGEDGFIFFKSMVRALTRDELQKFNGLRLVELVQKIDTRLKERGARLIFVVYPSKPILYREKIPRHWPVVGNLRELPQYRALDELERRGVEVLNFAPDLIADRAVEETATPAIDHHVTPDAYFTTLRTLLGRAAKVTGTTLDLPAEYPKIYSSELDDTHFRTAYYVNTNYPTRAPWERVANRADGFQEFRYSNPDGPLPSTVVVTDSYLFLMFDEFGAGALPYFRAFDLNYGGNWDLQALAPDVKLVILGISEQMIASSMGVLTNLAEGGWLR